MKPNLDYKLFDNEYAMINENDYIEYKENMSDGISKNIHDTICAFLNRNGGYIIVGVADNLEIIGIDMKNYDRFLNNTIDTIYHQGLIICEKQNIIEPHLISVNLYTNINNKKLLIINVNTDLDKYTNGCRSSYKLKSGESFFRLNVSNFKNSQCKKLYRYNEIESLEMSKMNLKIERLQEKYEDSILNVKQINRDYSDIEVENEILKQKLNSLSLIQYTITQILYCLCFIK